MVLKISDGGEDVIRLAQDMDRRRSVCGELRHETYFAVKCGELPYWQKSRQHLKNDCFVEFVM
jgi:hypothetical protein